MQVRKETNVSNPNQLRNGGADDLNPDYSNWIIDLTPAILSKENKETERTELSPERRQEITDALVDVISNSDLDMNYKVVAEPAHIAEANLPTFDHPEPPEPSPEPPEPPEPSPEPPEKEKCSNEPNESPRPSTLSYTSWYNDPSRH